MSLVIQLLVALVRAAFLPDSMSSFSCPDPLPSTISTFEGSRVRFPFSLLLIASSHFSLSYSTLETGMPSTPSPSPSSRLARGALGRSMVTAGRGLSVCTTRVPDPTAHLMRSVAVPTKQILTMNRVISWSNFLYQPVRDNTEFWTLTTSPLSSCTPVSKEASLEAESPGGL